MGCYRLEELRFENPTLRSVPVSYLITMETSRRRASYLAQLREFRPTARVVVVHNAGYKACRKPNVRTPAQDIWHANRHIARISAPHPLVLVLEDDVRFTPEFRRRASDIDDFLRDRDEDAVFAYNLGLQAFASVPISRHHLRVATGGFAHAVVYSRGALDRVFPSIRLPSWGLHDILLSTVLRTYAPRRACAVQPYERTDNASRWDVVQVTALLSRLCSGRAESLYALYDGCNNMGGLLPVLSIVVLATGALCASLRA